MKRKKTSRKSIRPRKTKAQKKESKKYFRGGITK